LEHGVVKNRSYNKAFLDYTQPFFCAMAYKGY